MLTSPIYLNNFTSTLYSGINDTVTTIRISKASGAVIPFPASVATFFPIWFTLTEGSVIEIVEAYAFTAETVDYYEFTVYRGVDSSTASSFTTSATVEIRVTAQTLNNILGSLAELDGSIPWATEYANSTAYVRGDRVIVIDPYGSDTLAVALNSGTSDSTGAPSGNGIVLDNDIYWICDTRSRGFTHEDAEYPGDYYTASGGYAPYGFCTAPEGIAIKGTAVAESIAIGANLINPVPFSNMQSGIPIIGSGAQVTELGARLGGAGSEAIIMSAEVDLTYQEYVQMDEQFNYGSLFFPNECGVIVTRVTGTITVPPQVQFGRAGADDYVTPTAITATVGARTRFTTLLDYDGSNRIRAETYSGATGGTVFGRFYFKGMYVESDFA